MFIRYKSHALVNFDWTTTRRNCCAEISISTLSLAANTTCLPVTMREVLQSHFGATALKPNPEEYLGKDFATLMETMALAAELSRLQHSPPVC